MTFSCAFVVLIKTNKHVDLPGSPQPTNKANDSTSDVVTAKPNNDDGVFEVADSKYVSNSKNTIPDLDAVSDIVQALRNVCGDNLLGKACRTKSDCKHFYKLCFTFRTNVCDFLNAMIQARLTSQRTAFRQPFVIRVRLALSFFISCHLASQSKILRNCKLGADCKWGHGYPEIRRAFHRLRKREAQMIRPSGIRKGAPSLQPDTPVCISLCSWLWPSTTERPIY